MVRLYCVSKKKSKVEQRFERALDFQKSGRFKQASDLFQQVLHLQPNQPDALYYLGVIAHGTGQLEEAVQWITQSLKIKPKNEVALNALAGVLRDQQRFPEALEFFKKAVALCPNEAYLHSNLGLVYNDLKLPGEAILCYQRALELDPQFYVALTSLGGLYLHHGEFQKSLEYYQRALILNPNAAFVHANIGTILNVQGRFAEALHYHESAFKITPNSDRILNNQGAALQALGRGSEAILCYQLALEINPGSHSTRINLGGVLCEQGKFSEAIACLRQALEIKPDCYRTLNSLGAALKETGAFDEALFYFNEALRYQPALQTELPIDRNRGATHYAAGRSKEAVDCFRKALEIKPDCAETFSDLLFVLNHLQEATPAELFAEHLRFGKQFNNRFSSQMKPHLNNRDPGRRLRIGFVSGDLRNHAVAHFIEPVFDFIDKSQFAVFCYYNYPVNDAVSERLRMKVDSWCNVKRLSDDGLASRIRNDSIDILVDLSGHTALNRLPVFARKPAPIQVSMIGYIQTTGLAAMDYRITDESLDPTGTSDHLNTEKLIRLPSGGAPFLPPVESPPVNDLPALKNGYVTFVSFNKSSKMSSEVFAAWGEILNTVSDSRVLIVDDACDFVAASLTAQGIAPDRLELYRRKPLEEYLALHTRADFALDTFPYNGGTTNQIAAWMGLPFVSIEGHSALSRSGACLLKCIGLPELIAANPAEYVQKVVAATQDLPRLAGWRTVLRSRFGPKESFGIICTQEIETAFREIWKVWCHEAELSV